MFSDKVCSVVLIVCFAAVVTVPAVADVAWQPQALPFTPEGGSGLGFALDSSGSAAFTYRSVTGTNGLYYGYYSGGSWFSDLVEAGMGTGAGSSLVFEGDIPHISYAADHTTEMGMNYATGAPGSWSTTVLAADTGSPRHSSIALDSDGNPAVGWVDQRDTSVLGDETLDFVYFDGTDWTSYETVTGDAFIRGGVTVLLPGAAEEAQLVFSDDVSFFAQPPAHATRASGGSWTIDSGLDGIATGDSASYVSGILTADGNPALCYMETWASGDIVYAEHDGTTWHRETVVDLDVGTGYADHNFINLARDAWGNVHLLYFNPNSTQVEYRYRDSEGSWASPLVIASNRASWMRLAIDGSQAPHFAYFNRDDEQLYYGFGNPVPEPATSALLLTGIIATAGLARRRRRQGAECSS